MKYKTIVTEKGRIFEDILKTNLLILFDERSKNFLKDFGVSHKPEDTFEEIEIGDILKIGDKEYPIVQMGTLANKELKRIGHTTFKLGSVIEPDNENMFLISGDIFPKIDVGTVIEII